MEEFDRTQRKQLRRIWKDKNKKSKDLYHEINEIPLSQSLKQSRWKAFGHMLRLPENTLYQRAMSHYFDKPSNLNKFPGKSRITLPP